MSKILLYYNDKNDFSKSVFLNIQRAFSYKGYDSVLISVDDDNLFKNLEKELSSPIFFAMGMNGNGLQFINSNNDLYEQFNIPYVALLGDPPYNNVTQSISLKCAHLLVAYIDRSHFKYLQRFFPANHIKVSFFLPWGGIEHPSYSEKEIFSKKRNVNIAFCGTHYFAGDPFRLWEKINSPITSLLNDVADFIISQPCISIVDAFEYVLKYKGYDDPKFLDICMSYFTPMYVFVRNYRRTKCIQTLVDNGFQVDVWGNNWDKLSFSNKLRIHGSIDYYSTLELYSNSKILLNENASFDEGSSERVFSAMLNGASIVTDYSKYYNTAFHNGIDMELYEWNKLNELPGKVFALLNDENKRQEMSYNAYKKAKSSHTWDCAADRILEAVYLYRNSTM